MPVTGYIRFDKMGIFVELWLPIGGWGGIISEKAGSLDYFGVGPPLKLGSIQIATYLEALLTVEGGHKFISVPGKSKCTAIWQGHCT